MATSYESSQVQIDLREFVKEGTWKSLLVELVETKRLDPWNIDIIEIVDGYIEVVKKMELSDLRVPANIILAASILLRMKSETLNPIVIYEDLQNEPIEQGMEIIKHIPEVPLLLSRSRLQPTRRVTLTELMDALNEAIKIVEKRETRSRSQSTPVNMRIESKNIDEMIETAYNLVRSNADKVGMARFEDISSKFEKRDNLLLEFFIPLLFLAHKGRVMLIQEDFFNEIIIKLME